MRILAALLLLAPAAGCVIDNTARDHGGGGPGPEVATISARWAFRNMLDGATTACPPGSTPSA